MFTDSQTRCIELTNPSIAVVAGAGSGKTSVLVERVLSLLRKRRARLDEILVITFTEKAAFELKERLSGAIGCTPRQAAGYPPSPPPLSHQGRGNKEILRQGGGNYQVEDELALAASYISTFHAFCARTLREHAPILGLDPGFRILEEHGARFILNGVVKKVLLQRLEDKDPNAILLVEELDFRNAVSCLEELVEARWHTRTQSSKFKVQSSNNAREQALLNALFATFELAEREFQNAKGGELDFHDLEIFTIQLLEGHNDIRMRLQNRFRHILVDECQDTNDLQIYLLSLLHHQNSLFMVGDPKQSIYRFRGANVHAFESITSKMGSVVRLSENFRARPELITFINNFFDEFEPLVPTRPPLGAPAVRFIEVEPAAASDERREKEAQLIAQEIRNLQGKGTDLNDIALLFQSLNSAHLYTRALSEAGIPYTISGGQGLLEKKEIVDVINALSVLADKNNLVSLIGLARSPLVGLTDEELYLLSRPSPEGLYKRMRNHHKGRILNRLEEIYDHSPPSEIIREIAPEPSPNIEKLIEIVRSIEETGPLLLEDLVAYIRAIKENTHGLSEFPTSAVATSTVSLMTVHAAKGLEFPIVFLPDNIREIRGSNKHWCFIKGTGIAFKLRDNPLESPRPTPRFDELQKIDKAEEELERKRLLHVAMTRAKELLYIPIHADCRRGGLWHKWIVKSMEKCGNICRWEVGGRSPKPVSELGVGGTDSELPTPIRASGPELLTPATQRIFTVSELETYARSPREYYLSYVLNLPPQAASYRPTGGKLQLSPSIRGDIVHKMIEYSAATPIPLPCQDALFASVLTELEINREGVPQEQIEEILGQFESYLAHPFSKTPEAEHEIPFIFTIDGHQIKGKLDMLIRAMDQSLGGQKGVRPPRANAEKINNSSGEATKGSDPIPPKTDPSLIRSHHWHIVDFKTGRRANIAEDAKKYELQILSYGLAVAHATNIHTGSATLLYLTKDGAVPFQMNIDKQMLDKTVDKLKAIIDGILRND